MAEIWFQGSVPGRDPGIRVTDAPRDVLERLGSEEWANVELPDDAGVITLRSNAVIAVQEEREWTPLVG